MQVRARIRAYLLAAIRREVTSLKREAKKYESAILLVGVGSIWIMIGRFAGIFLVSAVGALILAYGILKALD